MSLTIELAVTKSALVSEASPNQNLSGQASYDLYSDNGEKLLFLGFESFPASLRNYEITSVQISIPKTGWAYGFYLYDALSDFNAGSLTWVNKPSTRYDGSKSLTSGSPPAYLIPGVDKGGVYGARRLAFPALAIEHYGSPPSYVDSIIVDVSAIKLRVTYNPDRTAGSKVKWAYNPVPSYINPHVSNTFNWLLESDGYYSYNTANGVTQASAVFYWRAGESGDYTAVPISGNTQSVIIPAETFPVGTIQYYVSATGTEGTISQTPIYSSSTSDTLPTSTPISPQNTVEDGGNAITFKWNVSNASGTTPTKIDFAYKLFGESPWHYLYSLDGTLRQYTLPGGTFTSGETTWSVRAYNIDGSAGPWSSTTFVVVAAPATLSIATNAAPFTTFNWQGAGQQAWRLTVDGKIYGPHFGTDRSFTLPDYLEDGEHTASVEIQGQYGLWSQPGTVSFTVANTPGDPVSLAGDFTRDAALSWETESETADFLIYRDGVRIGHTAQRAFLDRFVLGTHSWRVVNRLPGGYYTASNTVNGTLRSCTTAVAPFSGGDWLELALSENSSSEQRFSYSRTHSLRHMRGAVYPVLELSPYEDGSGRYDTAFADVASAAAFEALRGRLVILKSRGGNVVIGALTSMEKRNKDFYIAFTFTVQQCHWEDYVDDQNG